MVIDEMEINQINTALILLQRRIERIVLTMDEFTEKLKECESLEDVKMLSLKISEVL